MSAVVERPENQIVEFDEFKLKLDEFKNRYDGVVYDLSDPEQEKQARSDRYAIGKVISALDSKHKELKAPLKARTDLIDGTRKEIKDELLSIQGKIKGQIEAREQEIQQHAEMLQEKVDAVRQYSLRETIDMCVSADQISALLDTLKDTDIDDSYEDRKADATLAQVEGIKILEEAFESRRKQEAELAELEKLRKEKEERERKEREEQIRKEAEEKAKREAEENAKREIEEAQRKEREAKEAQERAEREKKEAAERAAQQERERIEKEQRVAEAKAEAERKAEEERKAKKAHRNKIQQEALNSLTANGTDEDMAELTIELVDAGDIKHMSINY